MTDVLDDADDLFAVRSAPAAPPPPFPASFACLCGARDEVKQPAPAAIDCWMCRKPLAMTRWTPPSQPPNGAGREVTPAERARL